MSYAFRPVTRSDLPMLRRWLGEPHVRRWWGDAEDEIAAIAADVEADTGADLNIVSHGDAPFAYAQSWDVGEEPVLADQPKGTRGVDCFIGVPEMLRLGHSGRMMSAYAARLFSQGIPRLITNPLAENEIGTRAYLAAGFRHAGSRVFVDGPAPLLVMNPR